MESKGNGLKRTISEPFNFSHVTHTNQQQLPALHRVSDNELVTEFSVIRASQKPKPELKGIRAEDLHFKNFSSEDLHHQDSPDPVESKTSPTTTPPRSRDSSRLFTTPPTARNSRSIENFSRPAPRSPMSPTSPIAPPPRTSSWAACTPPSEPSHPGISGILSSTSQINVFDVRDPTTPENQSSLSLPTTLSPDAEDGVNSSVPHAVTTVDDSARLLRPLLHAILPSDLADVPEEDETTFWQSSPGRSSRPSTGRSSLRHAQSFPVTKTTFDRRLSSRQSSQTLGQSPLTSPPFRSPGSLDAPFEPEKSPSKRGTPSAKRFSIGLKAIDGSWEDVIDYSYEHAAEASCNFDWDRRSVEEDEEGDLCYTPSEAPGAPTPPAEEKSRFFPGAFRPSKLDTSQLTVPDLEPTSAQSKSTTHEAITPLHPFGSRGFAAGRSSKDSDYFKTKPSLVISSTFEESMTQEAMYEELLAGTEQNDPRFPFYSPHDTVQSHSVSPRSSGSLISKCNSQESVILSRAASVVRKHRSSNSSTSLPELVHSIHNVPSQEDVQTTPTDRDQQSTPIQLGHKRSISSTQPLKKIDDDEEKSDQETKTTRDRSKSVSDVAAKRMSPSKISSPAPAISKRNTSGRKSVPKINNRTSSRGYYSLFPAPVPKSPGKEVPF
jgi:hypothetical protein